MHSTVWYEYYEDFICKSSILEEFSVDRNDVKSDKDH